MLKRNEFEAALKNATLPNAVMLFGESHFLIDRYATLLTRISDANMLTLYHDEYNTQNAKEHLSQGSLFGGRNVLLIKSEKKIPKSDLDTLVALSRKNPDNLFIYAYYGTDFTTSNKSFGKKDGGESVRLFHPYFNEAKNIIMQEAKALGINMDHHVAAHLLESQNGDLALACNELPKLQLVDKPITQKEVDALVFGLAEVKLDSFIHSLLRKHDFKHNLMQLLESGEDEIRLITATSSFITQLYLFYSYIKLHGTIDSSAILGYRLPQFIEKERAELSIRFNPSAYKKMLRLLLETEYQMKSGTPMDKNALLYAAFIRLQTLL